MDAATAYFLKKYYPHVIKWWLVAYNPEAFRVWPSTAEKKEALRIEAEKEKHLALEAQPKEASDGKIPDDSAEEAAYNASTGSYSGLYGRKPVDEQTKEALDVILNKSSNQNTVDFLLSGGEPAAGAAYAADTAQKKTNNGDVILSPEHDDIVKEANAIYERLMQEAAEDEAKKQAEIEAVRQQVRQSEESQKAG